MEWLRTKSTPDVIHAIAKSRHRKIFTSKPAQTTMTARYLILPRSSLAIASSIPSTLIGNSSIMGWMPCSAAKFSILMCNPREHGKPPWMRRPLPTTALAGKTRSLSDAVTGNMMPLGSKTGSSLSRGVMSTTLQNHVRPTDSSRAAMRW